MVIRPGDDAGAHLDPLELAERAEGLLASDRATAVEAHLASCAQCRELATSVAGVTTTLAAEPHELPIPDGVAARIDAALAEEAAARGPRASRRGGTEGFWSGLRGRLPAIAAAAASVAVLGLIGYSLAGDGGGDDAATTTDAGSDMADSGDDSGGESADAPMEAEDEAAEEEAPADEDGRADLDAEEEAAGSQDDAGTDEGGAGEQAEAETFDTLSADELDALIDELQDVLAEQSEQAGPGADGEACGTVLAEELGGELLGAADTDLVEPRSVLVAVDADDPDTVSGWVLPDCTSPPQDAVFDFVIPRPAPSE